jgi:hypothetical protein
VVDHATEDSGTLGSTHLREPIDSVSFRVHSMCLHDDFFMRVPILIRH